jgi:2-keto-4-pentenoate hydratase/2-oxohepta-3-ene-1,7-dioic acid hydratase in catechol pathway
MQLLRFGPPGREQPAVQLPDGRRLDCSSFPGDYGPDFFDHDGLVRLRTFVRSHETTLPKVPADARLGPCIGRPHKLFCIGLNYRDHARETGAQIPAEPVVFAKATSAICGPDDDLMLPKGSQKTDWEVELLVVIGKTARYVDADRAMQHVAGYALHNDYSERHWQLERGGQWVKGKSFDTFAPIGPFFVPKDQVPDPQALPLWLSVNGKKRQDSNTREMVFGVAALVSYLSQCLTLEPGDCISTGTPAGVGLGCNPPEYLKAGDTVELGLGDARVFGRQRQRVVPFAEAR